MFDEIRFSTIAIKLVARNAQHRAIGHAYLYILQNDLHDEPLGVLEDVFIEEAYRGQGIGKQLLMAIIDRAIKAGCYKLVATSRFARAHVHSLYMAMGFEQHGFSFRLDLKPTDPKEGEE